MMNGDDIKWDNRSMPRFPKGTPLWQRVTIADTFATHDWVDDYLNSIGGVIKAAEASIYGSAG